MRSARIRLEDIADAISGIEQTLAGADFEAFASSWPMQRAVERGLEIISEASRGISEDQKSPYPDVRWAQIAGIGNILRHEYHRVEATIVWNITQTHLPSLALAVRGMLDGEEG
jgi:uncharacterized protein with HEPN domain